MNSMSTTSTACFSENCRMLYMRVLIPVRRRSVTKRSHFGVNELDLVWPTPDRTSSLAPVLALLWTRCRDVLRKQPISLDNGNVILYMCMTNGTLYLNTVGGRPIRCTIILSITKFITSERFTSLLKSPPAKIVVVVAVVVVFYWL